MLSNTNATYGGIAKFFHWTTVLLIITLIPLGIFANGLPYETGEQLAYKAAAFSLHKTLGLTLFFTALARIIWAFIQPKPGLLNADKPLESFLAETIHWLLYGSILLVPLTGWIGHAATTGFAPIWWPFGQSLPFVPKDDATAHLFASLHIIFERVLVVSLILHIAGALKHHLIDKDITLKRMLPGQTAPQALPRQHTRLSPIFAAIAAWAIALTIGASLGLLNTDATTPATPQLAAVQSDWEVQEGQIGITVRQLGSDVQGSFTDWTAQIRFDETPDADGIYGDVTVQISIPSLTLGSVTAQALGADFFASDAHPTAEFTANIIKDAETYVAQGALTLKGQTAPVNMPFTLQIDGDTATMTGQTTLNRTNYMIGQTYPDESSIGFDVLVDVTLTATKAK